MKPNDIATLLKKAIQDSEHVVREYKGFYHPVTVKKGIDGTFLKAKLETIIQMLEVQNET